MRRFWTAALAGVLALLSACGGQSEAEPSFAPEREERLSVYTSHKREVYGPIVKEFEERTGIWVEVVTGGTNELLERIDGEGSDAPRCDVMFGGGVESLAAYAGCFEPYTCAEADALKSSVREEGDLWTPFSSLPVVLIYNPRLIDSDALSGWADLLDQRWKGRIALADPAVSGSSYTAVLTLLQCLPGEDWTLLGELAENLDGTILDDSGEVPEAVSDGLCYLGVTLEETALRAMDQGADIAIVYPEEGTSNVPDGCALVRGAPHRENACRFLDFVQSKDVQQLVVNEFSRRAVRPDVAVREQLRPEGELGLIDYDLEWAGALKSEFLTRWAALGEEAAP